MAYTPTNWQTGDIITAEKLNKLENGVEAVSTVELPASTIEDEGKVLTVGSTGAAEWAESSGGDNIAISYITSNPSGTYGTLTYDEVTAALADNKLVFAKTLNMCYLLSGLSLEGYIFTSTILTTYENVTYVNIQKCIVNMQDQWSMDSTTFTVTPATF